MKIKPPVVYKSPSRGTSLCFFSWTPSDSPFFCIIACCLALSFCMCSSTCGRSDSGCLGKSDCTSQGFKACIQLDKTPHKPSSIGTHIQKGQGKKVLNSPTISEERRESRCFSDDDNQESSIFRQVFLLIQKNNQELHLFPRKSRPVAQFFGCFSFRTNRRRGFRHSQPYI